MAKITVKKFKDAVLNTIGNKTLIAQRIGVTRKALYDFLKKHPELEDFIKMEQERLVDIAESKLTKKLDQGDMRAIQLVLTTIGKNRGYTTREEIENVGTRPINISIERWTETDKKTLKE